MSTKRSAQLPNQPTLVEYNKMRFLISDAPTDNTLPLYLKVFLFFNRQHFKEKNVTHLVRVCESSYNEELFAKNNITIHVKFVF